MIINPVQYSGKKLPELDNPGTAADLLAGKQLVDQYGNPLTGTMLEVTQATPSISVASNGLITASAVQSAGHVAAGTKSATKQLTTQAGKTVTPGTSMQTAVANGRYTTGAVYVVGDANLKAENIKYGVSIFGVTGNCIYQESVLVKITNNTNTKCCLFHMSPETFYGSSIDIQANSSSSILVPVKSVIVIHYHNSPSTSFSSNIQTNTFGGILAYGITSYLNDTYITLNP